MKKLLLVLAIVGCTRAHAGTYYNLEQDASSVTMKVGGRINVTDHAKPAVPTVVIEGSSGSVTSNFLVVTAGNAPPATTKGTIYFDTTLNVLRVSLDGSTFVSLATGSVSGSFVNLQATTPGSQQSGHLNLSGTGLFATGLTVGGSTFTVAGGSATVAYQLSVGSLVAALGATITGNTFTVGGSSFTVAGGSATVAYAMTAATFIGDGSNLTNVAATNISASNTTAGTFGSGVLLPVGNLTGSPVASSVLPSTVAYTSNANTFSQGQTVTSQSSQYALTVAGGISGGSGGITISSTPAGTDSIRAFNGSNAVSNEWQGDNAYLAQQSAGKMGVGTTSPLTRLDVSGTARATDIIATDTLTVSGNAFSVGTSSFTVSGGSATVAYLMTARAYAGDGSGLTGLNGNVSGGIAGVMAMYTGASGLSSGNSYIVNSSTGITVQAAGFSVGASTFTISGGSGTFAQGLTVGSLTSNGSISGVALFGNGAGITNLSGQVNGQVNGALTIGTGQNSIGASAHVTDVTTGAFVTSNFGVGGSSFAVGGSSFTVIGGSATVAYGLTTNSIAFGSTKGANVTGSAVFQTTISIGGFMDVGGDYVLSKSTSSGVNNFEGDFYIQTASVTGGATQHPGNIVLQGGSTGGSATGTTHSGDTVVILSTDAVTNTTGRSGTFKVLAFGSALTNATSASGSAGAILLVRQLDFTNSAGAREVILNATTTINSGTLLVSTQYYNQQTLTGTNYFQVGNSFGVEKTTDHVQFGQGGPTLGTCTNGTLLTGSNDMAGGYSITTTNTSCVINFGHTWTNTPFCVCTGGVSAEICAVTSLSTTAMTITHTSETTGNRYYMCFGQQ